MWLRLALLFVLALAAPGVALAQVPGGAPVAFQYFYSGSGPITAPPSWLPVSAANPMPVVPGSPAAGTFIGNVGGYDSGPVTTTGAVNGSSHAAGTSVGGLLTTALARTNGGSGILTGLQWISPGGSTGQLVLRGWTKTPSATCTDQTAYAGNAADDPYLIPGTPVSITPAAPAVTTGDARTYASLTSLTWDYKNADTSPTQNIYWCVVTVATDTADESSSVRLTVSGTQN